MVVAPFLAHVARFRLRRFPPREHLFLLLLVLLEEATIGYTSTCINYNR